MEKIEFLLNNKTYSFEYWTTYLEDDVLLLIMKDYDNKVCLGFATAIKYNFWGLLTNGNKDLDFALKMFMDIYYKDSPTVMNNTTFFAIKYEEIRKMQSQLIEFLPRADNLRIYS